MRDFFDMPADPKEEADNARKRERENKEDNALTRDK